MRDIQRYRKIALNDVLHPKMQRPQPGVVAFVAPVATFINELQVSHNFIAGRTEVYIWLVRVNWGTIETAQHFVVKFLWDSTLLVAVHARRPCERVPAFVVNALGQLVVNIFAVCLPGTGLVPHARHNVFFVKIKHAVFGESVSFVHFFNEFF